MNKQNVDQDTITLKQESLIKQLQIPINEVSKIAGVSSRQIRYWTEEKEYLANKGDRVYKYSFRDLQKVYIMAQFLDRGLSLKIANEKAEKALARMDDFGSETTDTFSFNLTGDMTSEYVRAEAEKLTEELLQNPKVLEVFFQELLRRFSQKIEREGGRQ